MNASIARMTGAVNFSVATHVGQRRQENQDAFGVVMQDTSAAFWVADGMGGASGGAQASAIAVRVIEDALRQGDGKTFDITIRAAINQASDEIFQLAKQNPALEGMGTTVSGLVLMADKVLLFNVGDSRVYRVRGDAITQLTSDHTLVGELLNTGALTQEQAKQSPVSHMLTRSVGPSPDVETDSYFIEQAPLRGDIFLVCSDGLYNTISSAEIGYIIGEYRLHDALDHLVSLANMRGGMDNITGLLVECDNGFVEAKSENEAHVSHGVNTGRFVHIDLAEAAAADSFSKVKEEVDISAEILWGAQKQRKMESIGHNFSVPEMKIALKRGLRRRLTLIQRAIVVAAVVCFVTVSLSLLLKWYREQEELENIRLDRERRRILELSDPLEPRVSILEEQETAEQVAKRKELLARLQVDGSDISEAERTALRKRRIGESIKHFDAQLQRLSLAVDPGLLEFEKEAHGRIAKIRERTNLVEQAVERLDKSLVQWRRRLREVEELDTVNLASELATISPELQQKKDLFEQATWEYLKELENQGFDPSNEMIQRRVEDLIRERNLKLKELKTSAIIFIENRIVAEARERGLLLIEHDELVEDEKLVNNDIEYVAIRQSGDRNRKREFEDQLSKRRESLIQELNELGRLPQTAVKSEIAAANEEKRTQSPQAN